MQASGVLGELMISLGYLRLTERLTIVVIRARNLPVNEDKEDPGKWLWWISVQVFKPQLYINNLVILFRWYLMSVVRLVNYCRGSTFSSTSRSLRSSSGMICILCYCLRVEVAVSPPHPPRPLYRRPWTHPKNTSKSQHIRKTLGCVVFEARE